jgi:cysteine desulfurase
MRTGSAPRLPVPLVLLGMVSLQFSSAFVQDLFGRTGPAGAALLRILISAVPLNLIGGQERGLRAGTLNTAGIVGLGIAVELVAARRAEEARPALADVAVSTGSACNSTSQRPSHVLTAMGLPPARIRSSIRLSFGRFTTEQEVVHAARSLTAAARRGSTDLEAA